MAQGLSRYLKVSDKIGGCLYYCSAWGFFVHHNGVSLGLLWGKRRTDFQQGWWYDRAGLRMQPIKSLLDTPIRGKTILKAAAVCFLGLAVFVCAVEAYIFFSMRPPREKKLIDNFYAHQHVYERLRGMLSADKQLRRVAEWGVETTKGINKPPAGDFPVSRYNEYLALLKEIGGLGASGGGELPSRPCIMMYASGWAGDTRHVEICWMEDEPANQVTSLDAFYQTPKPRTPVYRRINGNWYLWADW